MNTANTDLLKRIWQTPLLKRILIVVFIGAIAVPAFDLFRVYPAFNQLLIDMTEREAVRTGNHLLRTIYGSADKQKPLSTTFPEEGVWQELTLDARDFNLWKARAFSPDGEIIFSTKSEEIGNRNSNDYFHNIVAKGEVFTKVENKQQTSYEGEILPIDVVEVYVPAMQGERFLGALEIYYDISSQWQSLQSLLRNSGLILTGLVLIIVTMLVFVIVRAARESQKLARATDELKTQEKIFQDVIDVAQEGILVTDAEQNIKIVNPAFTEMTGYRKDEVLEQKPSMLYSSRHDDDFYQQMELSLQEHKRWRGEIWSRRKDGTIFPELLSISTIENKQQDPTHFVQIFSDISKQKASEQQFQNMAYHDPLTELPNRLLFIDRLEQAIRSARRPDQQVVLFFLDLDGFKQVNDRAGHDAGDQLLIEVARRLSRLVRQEDTIARLGGDEFTMVIRGVQESATIQRIGDEILHTLNQPFQLNDQEFHIGVSIGVACYPGDSRELEQLIGHADAAMYHAKKLGKNRLVRHTDMD